MIVFKTVRENLAMLVLYQPDCHFLSYLGRMKVLIIILLNFISDILYAFHGADDFLELINTIFLSPIQFLAFLFVSDRIWNTKDIYELLDNIEEIIDARIVNAISKTIYVGTDKTLQYWSKIMDFVIIKITPVCVTFPMFVVSMFEYFATDLGNEAFDLPFHQWYPFDWKNPIAYGPVMAFEYLSGMVTFFVAMTLVKFEIAISLFLFSMIDDIKCDLESINRKARKKKIRLEIVKQFSQVIQFHSNVLQLSNNLSELGQLIHSLIFAWSLTAICSSMMLLQLEIEQNDNNAALLILLLFELFWSFALIFVVNELGERATLAFDEIDYVVDQFNSYYFSSDMKKMLPIFMAMTQKPIEMAVFGSITCSRDSFKQVSKSGFSYFMVLRKFRN